MKFPGPLRVFVINVALLALLYLVEQDLAFRNTYLNSLEFASSTDYSILTRVFTLTGRGTTLAAPPTLDWVQLLVLTLLLIDVPYLVRYYRRARSPASPFAGGSG